MSGRHLLRRVCRRRRVQPSRRAHPTEQLCGRGLFWTSATTRASVSISPTTCARSSASAGARPLPIAIRRPPAAVPTVCRTRPVRSSIARACTDSGLIGGSVTVEGRADEPCGSTARPKIGALFCVPPYATGFVNAPYGLPGARPRAGPGDGHRLPLIRVGGTKRSAGLLTEETGAHQKLRGLALSYSRHSVFVQFRHRAGDQGQVLGVGRKTPSWHELLHPRLVARLARGSTGGSAAP